MEASVTDLHRYASLSAAPAATRAAIAVAAFGQKLRNDPHLRPEFAWADIRRLGTSAPSQKGSDPGAELIELVDTAASLDRRR